MKTRDRLEIAGHRGAKGIAPENTLFSFQTALDLGVDMIELDVHLTTDGELVVMHDPRLERTTDGSGLVGDFTLAELKTLNAAARFEGEADAGRQAIPTLQEVYDLVQGKTLINIELKTAEDGSRYPGLEEKVVELVRRNDAMDTTVISSFNFPMLQHMKDLEPGLKRYAIVSAGYFQAMDVKGNRTSDVVDDLQAHGFSQVAVNKQFLSRELATLLHEAGFLVIGWIINDVDEMWEYAELPIDRITSDRPDLLLQAQQSDSDKPEL